MFKVFHILKKITFIWGYRENNYFKLNQMMDNYPPPLLSPGYINILTKSQRLQKEETLSKNTSCQESIQFTTGSITLFNLANWHFYVVGG